MCKKCNNTGIDESDDFCDCAFGLIQYLRDMCGAEHYAKVVEKLIEENKKLKLLTELGLHNPMLFKRSEEIVNYMQQADKELNSKAIQRLKQCFNVEIIRGDKK